MTAGPLDLHGHVAVVTGANHGIGAATARVLAAGGASVLLTYLRLDEHLDRLDEDPDSGTPVDYSPNRRSNADDVVGRIEADGGRADALEADLADEATHRLLFDAAEERFGPVDILVNNASGWRADSFSPGLATECVDHSKASHR